MKKLSILFATLMLTLAGAAHAGDILLQEADSEFIIQSVTLNGQALNLKQIEMTHVDVRQGMMSYRFENKNFLTACRGDYTENPFTKLYNAKTVIGLTCITQNGKFKVKYLKAG